MRIAIIGAGTAGITVAAQLRQKLSREEAEITLLDPAEYHYYQPAWTLVGAGTFSYENTRRRQRDLIPNGVEWMQEAVSEIRADENLLLTESGTTVAYDYLIACPGIQIDIDALPGLREGMDAGIVGSNYTDPEAVWKMIDNFSGGTALFTQPATPIKCGGAPQKIMYLAADLWRKKGISDQVKIAFATPGTIIFGTEPFKSRLEQIIQRKHITVRFQHVLEEIDVANKLAYYRITTDDVDKQRFNYFDIGEIPQQDGRVAIPFDIMHTAPPQSAPDFIKHSPLANAEGWIDVDEHTLQHHTYANVYALGDAAALPTAKTGAAVRKQAPVVVENLLAQIRGVKTESASYDGYSSCPIVTDYGKMLLAEFGYGNERMSDPLISKFVDTGKENYPMWLLKKYGLPFMYWNLMLKGRA
jgi:sulfide:quinone oxidoreductase